LWKKWCIDGGEGKRVFLNGDEEAHTKLLTYCIAFLLGGTHADLCVTWKRVSDGLWATRVHEPATSPRAEVVTNNTRCVCFAS
jgi:hypothetical protein